jgi:hypothetical protein
VRSMHEASPVSILISRRTMAASRRSLTQLKPKPLPSLRASIVDLQKLVHKNLERDGCACRL